MTILVVCVTLLIASMIFFVDVVLDHQDMERELEEKRRVAELEREREEGISLRELVWKTPSTRDDKSLGRCGVWDVAVFISDDEIEYMIGRDRYIFDLVGPIANRTTRFYPGDKIEFTGFVSPRGDSETDRNLKDVRIERIVSLVSQIDCKECYGKGEIDITDNTCYTCGGDGRLGEGTIFYRECIDCSGKGWYWLSYRTIGKKLCSDCSGRGKVAPQR